MNAEEEGRGVSEKGTREEGQRRWQHEVSYNRDITLWNYLWCTKYCCFALLLKIDMRFFSSVLLVLE